MKVATGRRAGRTHRQRGVACQDACAAVEQPEQGRVVVAVADGLGTRSHSDVGSQVACDAATQAMASEPTWDEPALRRAFQAAREAVAAKAGEMGLSPADLASTLHVAAVDRERVLGGSVGDGAVVVCQETPDLLLAPQDLEYANEVVPITDARWAQHFRFADRAAPKAVLLFTDGLTRLLLQRSKGGWQPYEPFFEAFLPALQNGSFDPGLVTRFLDGAKVDESWDDDKCLAVVALDDASG